MSLIDELVSCLQFFPGVGPKTAQRMAFFVLANSHKFGFKLAKTLQIALEQVRYCIQCQNFSCEEICEICSDNSREDHTICIVEDPSNIITLEKTGYYRGKYFVLGGNISPIDKIGPKELGLHKLVERFAKPNIREVIIAMNQTSEGEATSYYIYQLLKHLNIKITKIAQGIPCGGDIEYTDTNTLISALKQRREYQEVSKL